MPKVPGLVKGLGVTFGTMVKTLKDGPATTRYPHEKEEPDGSCPRRHRAQGGELHGLHAVRP